jgi:hypothetical protein
MPVETNNFRIQVFMFQIRRWGGVTMRQESSAQDLRDTHEARFISSFLRFYEARSVTVRAIFWGVLVVFVGFWLDSLVGLIPLSRLTERIAGNVIEGVFFTVLIWAFINARQKRRQRRLKEMTYLNHHIRNSLTVIEFAEGQATQPPQHAEMVKKASRRIRRCIERISENENCEIDEEFPEEP